PADDTLLTYGEFLERYVEPLANSDLLVDSLRLGWEVLAVGREGFLKGDQPGDEARGNFDFRLLVRDAAGNELIEQADVVIDATGVLGQPNWLGGGGVPAMGERTWRAEIEYGVPDIAAAGQSRYANQKILVIGAGHSAATNIVALSNLAAAFPKTQITWITRREPPAAQAGPIPVISNDPSAARQAVAEAANRCCEAENSQVKYHPLTDVEALSRASAESPFVVELSGNLSGNFEFDRIVASVGYRPALAMLSELQVKTCHANESFATDASGPSALLQPEPNFYILGAKSYGRRSGFTLAAGLRQVVDVFTIIGDRATLDLYVTALARRG
ncbi:MAG TPA: hypothetical protein VL096_21475, partial [Pirellulaceae bacterium]|nr:hypothetical protein [Pirellulaceae bacterium]